MPVHRLQPRAPPERPSPPPNLLPSCPATRPRRHLPLDVSLL
ncbi:hypothetical protein LINGRAPRIM_LOCUS3082 [Linum grandiflorum]